MAIIRQGRKDTLMKKRLKQKFLSIGLLLVLLLIEYANINLYI